MINFPYSLCYCKLGKGKIQKNEEEKNHYLLHFEGCIGLAFLLEVEASTICSAIMG